MPVEIKELHIKAIITSAKEEEKNNALSRMYGNELQKMKKEIVQECMEKILRQLQEKSER